MLLLYHLPKSPEASEGSVGHVQKHVMDKHTAGTLYLWLAAMARGNSSCKYIDQQGVKPHADAEALLRQVMRVVPHALHGHCGDNLDCYLSTCAMAQQFVSITGQVSAPKVLKQDLA